ncbi:MAG: hypothetical protein R2809_03845 [Flavobacteriales bacterium]
MNRLNLYSILAFTLLFLASCTRRAEQAADYNDNIVRHQLDIITSFDKFDSVYVDSIATKDQIEYAFVNMQSTIKRSILALDSIGPFHNDPLLEVAARELFKTYDNLVTNDYIVLRDIKLMPAESINVAIIDTSFSAQLRIHDMSKSAQDKFLMAQEEFGKKYHLAFE